MRRTKPAACMTRLPAANPLARLRLVLALLLGTTTLLLAPAAQAWELSGRKEITALMQDQQQIPLGSVDFTPLPDGRARFALSMDHHRFADYFLSMKEFKCLATEQEVLCHVPYPYAQPGTVREGDYAWLEHQLLFLFKQPRDFGAKLWNGLYFAFSRDEEGLVGKPQAVDLNLISAPPDNLQLPPYGPAMRDNVQDAAHAIRQILIR